MEDFPVYKTASVDSLIPYARNSRTHSDAQIDKIAASIKEFGFLNPVIIDGANGIIAGHGRVMAAKKLGMTELPVIEASHLTDAQRRAYVIADNRLALDAGWDDELLRLEFDGLSFEEFNLELTGFTLLEIKSIGIDDELFSYESDEDENEERPATKTSEGYVEFAVVVREENKVKIMAVLNRIKKNHNLENMEDALMFMVLSNA